MLDQVRERLKTATSRGLADAVSASIRDGVLSDGDRLPPIRMVATALHLSPTTVTSAWGLLVRGGLLHTDGRRGTVVAIRGGARLGAQLRGVDRITGLTRYRQALDRSSLFERDLSTGVPDPALLPELAPVLRRLPERRLFNSYLDDPALPELIELLRADWPYPAEQFTIVDGAMDGLDQAATQLLRFGDQVVVEHPAFPPLLDLLDAIGVQFVGVALDDQGLVVDQLAAALTADVRAVFLQPRAHNPTGVSYSAARIKQLADALAGTDAIIVEDDSTGSISTSPAVSLGLHLPDRTLHIRSYSKSHGPDLRLAAISGPAGLIEPIAERRRLGQGWTSRLLQSVLLDLLTRPDSIAQVERARQIYADRRVELTRALAGQGVPVSARDGINIWLPVLDETAALLWLAGRQIGAAAGRPFAAQTGGAEHLRVTCGLISTGHQQVAVELADASRMRAWRAPR